MRILVLCTHNSARSQMAEGWLRHQAQRMNLEIEVWSAGSEKTWVKPEAVAAMSEVGVDLSGYASKTLWEVPDPWNFDVVLTVCDAAQETCPAYPVQATRLHVSFPYPSGEGSEEWRRVRDALGRMSRRLLEALERGEVPGELELAEAAALHSPSP
jgi:arsenate reductase